MLRGLGFRDADLDRQLSTFSDGELTRASLARALAGDPDLLLLDKQQAPRRGEPRVAGARLTTIDAAVILVAHDRWFLESVTTAMLEDEGGRGLYFSLGPWHRWRVRTCRACSGGSEEREAGRRRHRAARTLRRAIPLQEVESQAGAGEAHADRSPRAGAQEGRGGAENLTHRRRSLGFETLKPARSGRVVIEIEGLRLSAGGKELIEDGTLVIEREEHVASSGRTAPGRRPCSRRSSVTASRMRKVPLRPRRRARVLLPARCRSSTSAGPCSTAQSP